MNLADRLAFFKELYFFEMARKDEVNASLGLPIGLATSLAAGVAYYVLNWPCKEIDTLGVLFLVLLIAGIMRGVRGLNAEHLTTRGWWTGGRGRALRRSRSGHRIGRRYCRLRESA
jgi:hypothetical protein